MEKISNLNIQKIDKKSVENVNEINHEKRYFKVSFFGYSKASFAGKIFHFDFEISFSLSING